MINLILLPFRGIIWLMLGCLFTLPWLIIVVPFAANYWLPPVLSFYLEKQSEFPCRIGSANINFVKGQVNLNDIVISNPNEFSSGDFLKIKQMQCKLEPLSIFQPIVKIADLNIEVSQFSAVQQNTMSNLQKFCKIFNDQHSLDIKSKKGWYIASAKLTFKGITSFRSYTNSIHTSEAFITKNFNFSNICVNTSSVFKENLTNFTTLESAYTNISDSLMNMLTNTNK